MNLLRIISLILPMKIFKNYMEFICITINRLRYIKYIPLKYIETLTKTIKIINLTVQSYYIQQKDNKKCLNIMDCFSHIVSLKTLFFCKLFKCRLEKFLYMD